MPRPGGAADLEIAITTPKLYGRAGQQLNTTEVFPLTEPDASKGAKLLP
jgi:hypothetical protein